MSLKKELLAAVPDNLKREPHLLALVEYIEREKIENKLHLASYLKKEISMAEQLIEQNKKSGATAVKLIRDKIVHLEVLKKCLGVTEEFLF